jgi:hypothetical protein
VLIFGPGALLALVLMLIWPRPRAPTIKLINHAILQPHWLMLWCIVGVADLSPNNTASDALLEVFIVDFRLLQTMQRISNVFLPTKQRIF